MTQKYKLFNEDLPDNVNLKGDLAIDTEAMGLNNNRDRLCVVQIADEEGSVVLVKFGSQSDYSAPNLKALLEDKSREKILHFARFDVAIIMKYLNVDMRNIFCTKIASKFCRTYTDYHGLKTIASELLGVDLKKEKQSSDWGADELTQSQINYAANDVIYLHSLRNALTTMLKREGRFQLATNFMNFIPNVAKADLMMFGPDMFTH